VIAALLIEGIAAFRDARGTSERRVMLGLDRGLFVNTLLLGAAVTLLGMIVPELSGISAATDRAMGDEPSDLILTWPVLPALVVALAVVTAGTIWRGPQLTGGLVRLLRGQSTLMGAAIWIYLATAAGIVISLAVMASDLVLGLASLALPPAIGWVSLGVSLLGFVASLSISAQLALHVFPFAGHRRALVFTILWAGAALLLLAAIWIPVYALLGGSSS
jgi:hypothetical protein